MLKIAASGVIAGLITLQLDGRITERWVKLLRRTCEAQLRTGVRVAIDLRNVSFVDREGIALLRSFSDRQVEILNALPFIAEQIRKAAP